MSNERTFIAIKPDGVQRGLIGEIIKRFETKGYKLVGMKLMTPTIEQAKEHYIDLASKPFYDGLCKYFSSGPICAMVWEGKNAIKGGRTLLGATNPADSLPGTIRGDLCVDVGRNVCHGSDGPEGAAREVAFWFKPEELNNWENHSNTWVYE
uniref:Nucleoside diphosphate kinase n=1 Tax=Neobodo designis TaxID=312471 RepID=A0A6U4Z043_NEODS|mmetsp:Transcript_9651/g.29837  ORF Transcript_9651/g.29837 Transcript_9651/m.29837 type:complete len:152 (+) Transcript_9651:39-494(+)|eukprot:CAMPEP_0174826800 /NCGR_PEP_ID=MMETSP1114-20130205/238_1 /TAXON_ID=312471 /ORGANISM="Neobodo designis, Strain CCAP 1951/1" /LENGTH=151 /DNA_ID=CAMNT_0016060367 /DNA_START=38 /DNA_END=493 /DNA_ORIENTATION=+